MDNVMYGYIRLSVIMKTKDSYWNELIQFGISERNIIVDKAATKESDYAGYQYLKQQILRRGDTLVIKELYQLGHSKETIKKELEHFKEMGVRVKILDIPATLTFFPPEQTWVLDIINRTIIETVNSLADIERARARVRQRDGIDAAHKRNIRFGRPAAPLPENWREILSSVQSSEIRPVDAVRALGISKSTFYRLYNEITK